MKGSFSLEVRLGLDARATKDLDLLRLDTSSLAAIELQDELADILDAQLDDGFSFRVRLPKPVRAEEAEPGAWRVTVEVRYGGREFAITAVDVVRLQRGLPTDAEPLEIESSIIGDRFTILALNPHRHAAEKYHAYARSYAWDRPSSRVKDLVDLVLLIESGLLSPIRLGEALHQVFDDRATDLPTTLTPPPSSWNATYPPLARATNAALASADAAWRLSADWYARALSLTQ